jgi:hypothetical protein
MATAAQVRANRANARKSTGPRTAEGKERASQNAVKHGLLAREAVIAGEDPEEFESYREGMLADLAPVGPVEAMLAERVVGLSWRLRRAERLQNEAFAALDDGTPTPVLDARLDEWKRLKGSNADRSVSGVVEDEFALGRVVVEDFTRARVLDRLLLYERRIESSLYRTMGELRKKQEARQAREATAVREEGSRSEWVPKRGVSRLGAQCRLPAGQESAAPVRLASFGANAVAGTRGTGILPVVGNHGQDAHATERNHGRDGDPKRDLPRLGTHADATETPDGATTNPVAHRSSIPLFQHFNPAAEAPAEGQSCETKPMCGEFQVQSVMC